MVFCGLAHHVVKRWLSFIARTVLSFRLKPHYCQTHWFQRFFVGWLLMLGRGGSLSLQELCFHLGWSRTIAKHTGFGWFLWVGYSCWEEVALFHCKSCAFSRRSRTIATHSGFRGFLWVGSSCWEEVTLFHCKSCAFIRSKPRYCQTHWFQRFFVGWLIMLGRGDWLSFIPSWDSDGLPFNFYSFSIGTLWFTKGFLFFSLESDGLQYFSNLFS